MKLPGKKKIFSITKERFLFIAILVFVFMSTTAIALSKKDTVLAVKLPQNTRQLNDKKFAPIPVLTSGTFPVISGQGALAVDLDSGISLYEKNPDLPLLPASTTKIVTALVALENYKLDQILTVPVGHVVGQKMGLYPGEQLRFEDLLYGLLVYSANDAAETLAANYCSPEVLQDLQTKCGRDVFIEAMNLKAKELAMKNSNFQNPVGLDGSNQVTTAEDLIRVSEVAMKNPEFAKVVGTKETIVSDITGNSKYKIRNINELLGSVDGVKGVKTGWTENARENLVTYMERDGRRIMIVILGSQDRFGETRELINWIFSNYTWKEVKPD